ncbi:MAG: MMPL family transporter [Planctomycetota bacterium]|nr:MMPL family transporter [Planctomycetota bacterium]
MFSLSRTALIRRCFVTAFAMLALGPFLAWWSLRSVDTMFNTPHHWIPATNQQRQEFEWFCEHFESQALVVISWRGCTVDDSRLAEFEVALLDPAQPDAVRRKELFDRVISGYSTLRQLTSDPIDLSREDAIARLRGILVGPDGSSSCAVVMFTDRGGYERREAIEIILDTAQTACGLARDEFRLAGPPVDGVAIDRAGVDTMLRYAVPSALLSLLLCWRCLREWHYALAVFAAAAFGEGLCLALVYWSGQPMNAILILMPPFVFVLTIAAGVHVVNYYFDEARAHGAAGAPERAMRIGWLPCALATVTTGVGLGSLLVSDVEPIRRFGVFATIGVVTTLFLLFALLPGVMELWPVRARRRVTERTMVEGFWGRLASVMIRRASIVTVGSIAIIMALGWGLLSIQTSIKLRALFSPHDRVLADYAWLEQRLGPMVPVEVIVHFRADSQVDFLRRIEVVQAVARVVRGIDHVDGVMSAETFTPPIPDARRVMRRTLLSKRLTKERARLVDARYLHEDSNRQSWRIAARVPALSDLDYEQFLDELKEQVAPAVTSASASIGEPIAITVTGAIPLIYQTQRLLLADMLRSFVAAFGIVGVVLMIVLRSVRAGLVAMIPNVFPTAAVFGLMGWLSIPIDLGSVMTASIALGIAVVDTLHFLTWFRREVAAGCEPPEAIRRCYCHCATAMLQTSVICGVGMLAFVFSSFVPASRFAWMVFVLLMTALFADLVILPALLAGPLGRVFVVRGVK